MVSEQHHSGCKDSTRIAWTAETLPRIVLTYGHTNRTRQILGNSRMQETCPKHPSLSTDRAGMATLKPQHLVDKAIPTRPHHLQEQQKFQLLL